MKKFLSFILYSSFFILSTPAYAVVDRGPGPAGKDQLIALFTRIINLSVEAAFSVLLIMLVYAGIKFLTSGGDPKAISSAGTTITWAILGILFLAIAWLLLLLIRSFTGVDVTKFCIGFDVCS